MSDERRSEGTGAVVAIVIGLLASRYVYKQVQRA